MTGLDETTRATNGFGPAATHLTNGAGLVLPVPDVTLVREVRRVVADRLAERLQAQHLDSPDARRELARSLVAAELSDSQHAGVHAGLAHGVASDVLGDELASAVAHALCVVEVLDRGLGDGCGLRGA